MKKIAGQILEELKLLEMDFKTAFDVLGLQNGDYDGVDKAFKKMAMKHHPDRGGDPEMMKKLNLAKEVLQSTGASGSPKSKEDERAQRDEINKQRALKAKVVTDFIFKSLDKQVNELAGALKDYFEKHLSKKFSSTVKYVKADNSYDPVKPWKNSDYYQFHGFVRWKLWFKSEDGRSTFVIELDGYINERDFENALSVDNLDMEVSFETFALNNGKKTKMQQKRYSNRAKASKLGSPEEFFPLKKIQKMTTTETKRLTKRADARAFLITELGGKTPFTDKEIILIPIGTDKFVRMHRMLWNRTASWSFDDITYKKSEYSYESELRRGSPESLFSKMDKNSSVMEVMPDFAEIVREVIDLIKKEKYKEAGKLVALKNKEYSEVIYPAIKAKTIK